MELRIALTVLPVGPRGRAVLDGRTSLWFALQISAGFDIEVEASELDKLWPWVLHVIRDGKVELRTWVIDGNQMVAADRSVPAPAVDTFTDSLRKRIEDGYENERLRQGLDLRLLYPEEAAKLKDPEAYQRACFAARSQYLATLPGEMSRRLLATLYVQIPVGDLFVKDGNGVWQAKGQTLWIAPKAVNGSTVVTLAGDPVPTTGERRALKAVDGGTTIVAEGPGFKLKDYLDAASTVFNLQSYDVEVNPGDARYIELESLLLKVLDPFAELHDVRNSDARQFTELVAQTGARRLVSVEAFAALTDAWRVAAFAAALRAQFPDAIHALVDFLLPKGLPKPPLTIPERWGAALDEDLAVPDILNLSARLSTRLGLESTTTRATLSRVAERCGFAEIARLLVLAFDDILAATPGVPDKLGEAWAFHDKLPPDHPALTPLQLNERRATLALAALTQIRERKDVAPRFDDLKTGIALRAAVSAELTKRWTPRKDAAFGAALVALGFADASELIEFKGTFPEDFAASYLDAVWPTGAPEGPELPARGLPLRLGAETRRLTHEDDGRTDTAYREVAGVLLLARRGKNANDIASRQWRALTAGAAMVGELGDRLFTPEQVGADEFLPELLPIPIRPVFHEKLARADVAYHGQPMLAHSALERAYNAEDYLEEDDADFDAAYTFHPLGNFETLLPAAARASRAPALRYGDTYEFRAGVLDQAGGLAPSIADENEPWRLDPAKLVAPTAPGNVMLYPRKVPPGEINVLPNGRWARIPDDVTLRAREFWAADHRDADSLPAVLLTGAQTSARFTLLPPAIDEHTLVHWAIPQLDDKGAAVRIEELKTALTALFEQRAVERVEALHDPAVTAIGIRIRGALGDNTRVDVFKETVEPPSTSLPFKRGPVDVQVTRTGFDGRLTAVRTGTTLAITLPEGTFAVLEVFPLVPHDTYESRFARFDGLTEDSAPFAGFVAFKPSVVLLESATDRLPSAQALFGNLKLVDTLASGNNGDIHVRFDGGAIQHLAFVDRFVIARDRWVWRNLPVVPAGTLTNRSLTDNERRRRAASGPPEAVFTDKRDEDPTVIEWEEIAAIDRGFAERPPLEGVWPRVAADDRTAGGPANNVLLAIDNRDGTSAADYLRFSLHSTSRYAGVLPAPAPSPVSLRRIVTGFRGAAIKPPKVLGIVPLTRSLDDDPFGTAPGVTPLLVLLDESFFREYGVGERIELRLTLENLDFSEDASSKVPYRTGPLPDHWLSTGKYFLDRTRTQAEDEADPIALDLFGPFGYSLDLSPSEALANASAFIAYPHADVRAHWAMFVRMRRRLDRPSAQQISDWSDVHALYTLPDARLLASSQGLEAAARIEINGGTATLHNLRLILDPAATPAANEQKVLMNTAAGSLYRYYLLVSRVLAGAGQGFDAEIPVGLWNVPLFKPESGYQDAGEFVVEFNQSSKPFGVHAIGSIEMARLAGGEYRGRILEVIVNGHYEKESRLDGITGWTEFWKALLDDEHDIDAAGMIRRVSDAIVTVIR